MASHHRRAHVIAIIAGLLAAVPLPLVSFGSLPGSCGPGTVVATLNDSETPWVVVDSPVHGGWAIGSLTTHNGSETTKQSFGGATNGSVYGWFEFEDWTVYANVPRTAVGTACSEPFATLQHDRGNAIFRSAPAGIVANYTNDSQAPTYTGSNVSGEPMIYYYAGFYTETATVSTCGSGNVTLHTSSDHVRVGLGFESGGSWHILGEILYLELGYSYEFPGNGGTWAVDNLSAPGGPGGGWSFSYLGPC